MIANDVSSSHWKPNVIVPRHSRETRRPVRPRRTVSMPHRIPAGTPSSVAIFLAFMSAVMYGVSDYVGGRASRRSPATAVALMAELVIFAACIVVIPLFESADITGRAVWWGLAAGVTS